MSGSMEIPMRSIALLPIGMLCLIMAAVGLRDVLAGSSSSRSCLLKYQAQGGPYLSATCTTRAVCDMGSCQMTTAGVSNPPTIQDVGKSGTAFCWCMFGGTMADSPGCGPSTEPEWDEEL